MVSKFRRIMQTICGIVIVVILTTAIVGCVNPGTTSGGEPIGDTVSDTKKEDAKKIADTKGNEPSIFNTQTSAQKREEDRDARDAKSTTQRENRHTEPRIEERPKETPTFEKMADGTIWYNNEKDNYTFKFPLMGKRRRQRQSRTHRQRAWQMGYGRRDLPPTTSR